MDKKIELIETNNGWNWFILKYDTGQHCWYTADTGFETTYEEASAAARCKYDSMAA